MLFIQERIFPFALDRGLPLYFQNNISRYDFTIPKSTTNSFHIESHENFKLPKIANNDILIAYSKLERKLE